MVQQFTDLPYAKMEKVKSATVSCKTQKPFSEPVPLTFQGESILRDLYPLDEPLHHSYTGKSALQASINSLSV
jgi:hypothetical protein